MQRGEMVIESRESAIQFFNMLNDVQATNDMKLIEADGKINSTCVYQSADDVILAELRAMFACASDRTHHHIRRDGSDTVFIHINMGQSLLYAAQNGHDHVLGQGMAGLYVNNAPIKVELKSGADIMGINLPRSMTRAWREAPEDLAVTVRDPDHPALHMLTSYVRLMLDSQAMDAATRTAMNAHVAELAGLWLGGLKLNDWRDDNTQARQTARYHAIRDKLRQNCAVRDVSAVTVGHALGLSERTVQHVLTQQGTSFSRLLNDARADMARGMLQDPRHKMTPVIAIALSCGFNDLSTFYRAFNARYGERPAAFRSV